MKFLRDMDLYKAIVLLSFVVLPLGAWWSQHLDEQIAACNKAIHEATRPGGLLERIGGLQRRVEVVVQNSRITTDATKQHGPYFEGQLIASGASSTSDFSIGVQKVEPVVSAGTTRQKADDYVVDVTWGRDYHVKLDFVYAVLFNCESSARAAGDNSGRTSIWKLRELQLVNATDDRLIQASKTPPPELADQWSIKQMKFARREPKKGP